MKYSASKKLMAGALAYLLILSGFAPVFALTETLGRKSVTAGKQRSARKTTPMPTPTPAPAAPANPQPTTPPAATPSPSPAPQGPPPEKSFADVTKDFEAIKGLFTVYRKDDKTFLEIMPDQMDKVYLFSPTLESGIGERGFLSAQLLDDFAFSFVQRGKNVQFVVKNLRFRASDDAAIKRAVARSFADSILASTKIESLPHPERKSVLVDLNAFMLTDVPLIGYALESTYRLPYKLDPKNSAFTGFKGFPENNEIEAVLNFSVAQPLPPPLVPSPVQAPPPPNAPPDLRSLQFRVRYSLSTLPSSSYRPRIADDRVGHFTTNHQDFTDDTRDTPYVRYVNRWNLEKADPTAELSEPKKPIVFWLENAIPVQYRDAIAKGVLMWNNAFEKVGFKNAVVVKQQPDNSDWDPADVRYNTIRWFVATDAGFAIGPSRTNPYTGEIYDADISFSESMSRAARGQHQDLVSPVLPTGSPTGLDAIRALKGQLTSCDYASQAQMEATYGYEMILAREGVVSPEVENRFVNDFFTSIAAHEVGHTLGLRHNFRASTLNPVEKLQDSAMTNSMGLTGSVMDYIPVNIAPAGSTQGQYWQTSLGPYDYWAIEYAYRPVAAASPEGELPELRKIASRVADAKLAYGTDEDIMGDPIGIDPRTNRWDNGTDPLAFYDARSKLAYELVSKIETRIGTSGAGYQRLRRAFNGAMNQLIQSMIGANKYIGAVYHNRDHIGDPGNRLPYEPVSAKDQRRALALLKTYAIGEKSFQFSPVLLNKLAISREASFDGDIFRVTRLDYPIHANVASLHRTLLDRMYHPILLSRLQDSEVKYANPADRFTMSEMFQEVNAAIWSEVNKPVASNIDSFRRNLQREQLRRLQQLVLRPQPGTPEDASTLARYSLVQLGAQINKALSVPNARLDMITRAHLQETAARIKETLAAQQQRAN